ncbi:Lrp/AsnC family transcriptional regulator [Marinomonas algicola]|jgi:Lrp/AsnC family transcriptional regulator, leucine-responsive regulatory protein|uniref:Lrp/AsnC family transcriptional regulator n=1 Tax=Marinomonas algicola TaxID=2773454 RepID=UPI00174CA578|nr:Lrp/AsnC family transcriptional regulator [Marinomonas algicola]
MKLDSFDQKIVALLVDDARLSVSDIGRSINLSRSAVAERLKRLEESGTITGYHAKVADNSQSKVSAYFAMTFSPLSCDLLLAPLTAIPEVKLAHSISGDVDLMVFVEAESMSRLNAIRESFDHLPNIQKVMTHTVLIPRIER